MVEEVIVRFCKECPLVKEHAFYIHGDADWVRQGVCPLLKQELHIRVDIGQ